jgi:hypothetical protein
MIIDAKIRKARKDYKCESCGHIIKKGDCYVRFFGSSDDACKNPPPFVIKECKPCGFDQAIRHINKRLENRASFERVS